MVRLKRRKKIEGWALDVPDSGVSLRQRIADNNKLWLFCAVTVVLICGFLIMGAQKSGSVDKIENAPRIVSDGAAVDEAHNEFASKFAKNRLFRTSIISAQFLDQGRFKIVVSSGMSADDICYMSKIAAEKITHQLNHRVVVQVYARSVSNNTDYIRAVARWNNQKYGYYVVDLKDTEKAR